MRKRLERQDAIRRIVRSERVQDAARPRGAPRRPRASSARRRPSHATSPRWGCKKLPEGVYVLAEDLHLQRMVVGPRTRRGAHRQARAGQGVCRAPRPAWRPRWMRRASRGSSARSPVTTPSSSSPRARQTRRLLVDTLDKFRGSRRASDRHPRDAARQFAGRRCGLRRLEGRFMAREKVVLAYSGGLDTSVAIRWLQENNDVDVIALAVDVGQERQDLEFVRAEGARRSARWSPSSRTSARSTSRSSWPRRCGPTRCTRTSTRCSRRCRVRSS